MAAAKTGVTVIKRSLLLSAISIVAAFALAACGDDTLPVETPPAAIVQGTPSAPSTAAAPVRAEPPGPAPGAPTPLPRPEPAPVAVQPPALSPTPLPEPTPAPAPEPEASPTPLPIVTPAAVPTETPAPLAFTPTPEPEPELTPVPATNGTTPHAEEVLQTEEREELTTVEVVKILRPSVVQITTQVVTLGTFNQPIPQEGVGTGILLDKEGNILTNNHVVEGAETITVILDSGESMPGELVGGDFGTDTAVIHIDPEGLELTPARLGDASTIEVGEDVVAMGHALGLPGGPTVTKGVVSALGRSIETAPQTQTIITDLIQTDTAINPGNSGGPLANNRAEVIGMNTAIFQQSQGIGFSINIDDAQAVAVQLIENGFVNRGFLGITPVNVTPFVAGQLDLPVTEGILVQRVIEDTAADDAGLEVGDVIVRMAGEPIPNTGELSKFLIAHPPGENIEVILLRAGDEIAVEVTLRERPRQ